MFNILALIAIVVATIPCLVAAQSPLIENTDLIIVSDLLTNYDKVKESVSAENFTNGLVTDIRCLPKKGRRRILFMRNYYDCSIFLVQNGSLSKNRLANLDIDVSYFADVNDIFSRCLYNEKTTVNDFIYEFREFFKRYEGEFGENIRFAPIYRPNGVYHMHSTDLFNVVFVKLDADIFQWETWLNNILFAYKDITGKPTLAIILGDISRAVGSYSMTVFDEIINSGQVIAVIETNSTVDTQQLPSDSWKNIVWEKMNYDERLFRIFAEPVNATNFNLIINKKKYSFFMDPVKKLKCNYPLCYLNCQDAATHNGYCIGNITKLIIGDRQITTPEIYRHWVLSYSPSASYSVEFKHSIEAPPVLIETTTPKFKVIVNDRDYDENEDEIGYYMGKKIVQSSQLPSYKYRREVE